MRILLWNVEKFNDDKFFMGVRDRVGHGEEEWGVNPSVRYLNLLLNTLGAHAPDIIIIIEVGPGGAPSAGSVPSDKGSTKLLARLAANWALVPPLVTGSAKGAAEAIAVYYRRSANLYFTGPWRWPGGAGPAAPAGGLGEYPDPYDKCFPGLNPDRVVPGGANLHNAGSMERRLAGQWVFTAAPGAAGVPPAPVFFGCVGTRSPFRVTFFLDAGGGAGTNYDIVIFHAPPGQDGGAAGVAGAPSTLGTQAAANLAEVQAAPANQVNILCGDFNVSLFDAGATGPAYGPVAGGAWTQVINSVGAGIPNAYPAMGYLMTMMKPVAKATPEKKNGYPAFGYMSGSVDNAFVRGAVVNNATIANIVTGAPYTAVAPAPAGVPAGHYPYATALAAPPSLNSPAGISKGLRSYTYWLNMFRELDNFRQIRTLSDHIPIIFDVV